MDKQTRKLTLTRKPNESIVISGPSTVTIRKTSGSRVTIEIRATDEVTILRAELINDNDPS